MAKDTSMTAAGVFYDSGKIADAALSGGILSLPALPVFFGSFRTISYI